MTKPAYNSLSEIDSDMICIFDNKEMLQVNPQSCINLFATSDVKPSTHI